MRTNGFAAFCTFVPLLIIRWYDIGPILARYSLWIGIWALVHYASLPLLETVLLTCVPHGRESALYNMLQHVRKSAEASGDEKKLYNLRRLLRAQIYCLTAASMGAFLLFRTYLKWPLSLLLDWDPYNDVFFEIAIANWLFATFEDSMSYNEVIAHMTLLPDETKFELFSVFATNLTLHHFLTVFAYAWSMYTRYLGGLCVFGLLFETPVLLMNLRDLMAAFEKELNYPHRYLTVCHLKTYSVLLQVLFHSCRTLFCFLWPYSLLMWRKELTAVPLMSRLVYHFLGASFFYVNWKIFSYQITRYMLDDMVRTGLLTKEAMWKLMKVEDELIAKAKEKEARSNGTATATTFTLLDQSKQQALEKILQQGDSDAVVTAVDDVEAAGSSSSSGSNALSSLRKKYTLLEVAQHHQRDDAWIIIDEVVYDVSKFIDQHPGGAQLLLDVLGKDASDAFEQTGHSNSAKMMLQWYNIGDLAAATASACDDDDDNDSEFERSQTEKIWRTRKTKHKTAKGVQSTKQSERMILTDSGPYMQFRPYYNDLGYIVLPSVMFYYCFALMVTSSIPSYSSSDVAAVATAAVAVEAATTTSTTVAATTDSAVRDDVKLLVITLGVCIVMAIFYAVQGFTGAYRFKVNEFCSNLLRLSTFTSAVTVAVWIAAEFSLMMGYGLTSAAVSAATGTAVHAYSVPTIMKLYQLSLLVSYTIETVLRKAAVIKVSTLSKINNTLLEMGGSSDTSRAVVSLLTSFTSILAASFDRIPLVFISALLLDVTALYRFVAPEATEAENELAWTAGVLILVAAVMRCIAMRLLPGKSSSDECNHAQMLALSSVAVIALAVFAFIYTKQHSSSFVSMTQLTAFARIKYTDPCSLVIFTTFAMFVYYQTFLLRWSTTSFSSQSIALFGILSIALVTESVLFARWWAYSLLFLGLLGVSVESWRTIKQCGKDPPKYLCCAKQMEDGVRYTVAITLARFILTPMEFVLTLLFPPGYMLYVYPGPVTDMGESVDYGIAYQVNGKKVQEPPSTFILNVGFFGESAYDYARTAGSTGDMMMELAKDKEAGKKGFVSDMVAAFPIAATLNIWNLGNGYGFREVNFSAWTSDQAAHDWYVNSEVHRGVVKEYHNGGFFEFSAMLANLKPAKPIRWEVRCRECRMMSPGPGNGTCPHCGYDKVEPLPYM